VRNVPRFSSIHTGTVGAVGGEVGQLLLKKYFRMSCTCPAMEIVPVTDRSQWLHTGIVGAGVDAT
jgi:hypothetical protein